MQELLSYYLPDIDDEGRRFAGSLEEIAAELARVPAGPSEAGIEGPIGDGATLVASYHRYAYVPCHRQSGGEDYLIPRDIPGIRLHALAQGRGLGWDEDFMISWSVEMNARFRDAGFKPSEAERRADERLVAAELLAEWGDEDTEYLVTVLEEGSGILTFHKGPPASCTFEGVPEPVEAAHV